MSAPHLKVTMKEAFAYTRGDGQRVQLNPGETYILPPEDGEAVVNADVVEDYDEIHMPDKPADAPSGPSAPIAEPIDES